jgi:hypothetical protein
MLDFNELCVFGEGFKRGAVRVKFEDHPAFADRFAILHADKQPAPRLRVHGTAGSRAYDVVGSTIAMDLVSPRFLTTLRDGGITGWDSLPIDTGTFKPIRGYELLRVLGRCGQIDNSKSERTIVPPRGGRSVPGWRGIFFDPSSWDGSDVFGPTGTGYVFLTKRAAQLIQQMKLSNVSLEPLASVERLVL